jgi:hypothetical protein
MTAGKGIGMEVAELMILDEQDIRVSREDRLEPFNIRREVSVVIPGEARPPLSR